MNGSISDKIGNLTKLKSFLVGSNKLTGTIPTTIGNCQALELLTLSENKSSGPIPKELGNVQTISEIVLGWNELTGPLPSEIFSPSLAALWVLHVQYNELTGQIPNNWVQLPNLAHLALHDNKLSGTLSAVAEGEFPHLRKYLAQACRWLDLLVFPI